MSDQPLVDVERIRSVYEDLTTMEVALDRDPLIYGPKRLNEKTSEIRAFLTKTERLFLSVAQDLALLKRKHRLASTDFKLLEQDLLANDPNVRSGRSVKDREAMAHIKLRTELEEITDLESAINDLESCLTVVKAKRTDLKDVQRALRDQIKLCQEEIGLGNNWGSRLPPGSKNPIDPMLVGSTQDVGETINDLIGDVEGEIDLAIADGSFTPGSIDDEPQEVVEEPEEVAEAEEPEAEEEDAAMEAALAAVASIDDILAAEVPPEPVGDLLDDILTPEVEAEPEPEPVVEPEPEAVVEPEPVETPEEEPAEEGATADDPKVVAAKVSKDEKPAAEPDEFDDLINDVLIESKAAVAEDASAAVVAKVVEAPAPEPTPETPPEESVEPAKGEVIDLAQHRDKVSALPGSVSQKDAEDFLDGLDLSVDPVGQSAVLPADEPLDLDSLIGMFK